MSCCRWHRAWAVRSFCPAPTWRAPCARSPQRWNTTARPGQLSSTKNRSIWRWCSWSRASASSSRSACSTPRSRTLGWASGAPFFFSQVHAGGGAARGCARAPAIRPRTPWPQRGAEGNHELAGRRAAAPISQAMHVQLLLGRPSYELAPRWGDSCGL